MKGHQLKTVRVILAQWTRTMKLLQSRPPLSSMVAFIKNRLRWSSRTSPQLINTSVAGLIGQDSWRASARPIVAQKWLFCVIC
jgi:hypothetical protein